MTSVERLRALLMNVFYFYFFHFEIFLGMAKLNINNHISRFTHILFSIFKHKTCICHDDCHDDRH